LKAGRKSTASNKVKERSLPIHDYETKKALEKDYNVAQKAIII